MEQTIRRYRMAKCEGVWEIVGVIYVALFSYAPVTDAVVVYTCHTCRVKVRHMSAQDAGTSV